MAKKNATAEAVNGTADQLDPNAAQAGDQPVSSDAPPADAEAVNAIDMEDFISRQDRASWLSVADAAKYLTEVRGATDIDSQKMRNAANNRKEFNADGATLKVRVPGYDIKPLTYLHQSAVDLYHDNNASGNTRSGRVIANGKRWIVRVKSEDQDAVIAALAPFGITLEVASAPHKKDADATASNGTADAVSADAPNAETQAANLAQAADADNAGAEMNGDQPADQQWPRVEEFTV